MFIKYFIPKPGTLEELKSMYRALAMRHHPDVGGDVEVMKVINNEFDSLFPSLKDIHKNKDGETYTAKNPTTETPEHFREIINSLLSLKMDGVDIELIGSFLWVSGNTYIYRAQIKALGFKWSQNKTAWYISPEGYRKYGKKQYDLDEIRAMYKTSKVTGEAKTRQQLQPATA